MALTPEWRTINLFALVGLTLGAIAGAFSISSAAIPVAITIVLCPAALVCVPLFGWAFGFSVFETQKFYILWAVAAVSNAMFYALVGAAYVRLRKRLARAATN
jgi:hypothetical protein